MKNADMSAMPLAVSRSDDGAVLSSYDFVGGGGLTKREYFAGLAMQGLLASGQNEHVDDKALAAVGYADALLAALEEK